MIGLGILSGFMLFFIVEKLIRMSGSGSGHAHSHDHKKSDDVPDTVTKKGLGPGGIIVSVSEPHSLVGLKTTRV